MDNKNIRLLTPDRIESADKYIRVSFGERWINKKIQKEKSVRQKIKSNIDKWQLTGLHRKHAHPVIGWLMTVQNWRNNNYPVGTRKPLKVLIELTRFAEALEQIKEAPGIGHVIDRMKKNYDDFFNIMNEVFVAYYFSSMGFIVEFVEESTFERPDLKVIRDDIGELYVECKTRNLKSENKLKIDGFWNKFQELILSDFLKHKYNMALILSPNKEPEMSDVEIIRAEVGDFLLKEYAGKLSEAYSKVDIDIMSGGYVVELQSLNIENSPITTPDQSNSLLDKLSDVFTLTALAVENEHTEGGEARSLETEVDLKQRSAQLFRNYFATGDVKKIEYGKYEWRNPKAIMFDYSDVEQINDIEQTLKKAQKQAVKGNKNIIWIRVSSNLDERSFVDSLESIGKNAHEFIMDDKYNHISAIILETGIFTQSPTAIDGFIYYPMLSEHINEKEESRLEFSIYDRPELFKPTLAV